MSDRRFFKTTYTFAVLSDEPIPEGMDLAAVLEAAETGNYVADWTVQEVDTTELSGKAMADALYAASCDPTFFQLDDEGNPAEGDPDDR